MSRARGSGLTPVLAVGVAAFLVACLSLLDMFLPRPYDGVALDPDSRDLVVRSVADGSGAALAGIIAGDRILGVGRVIVREGSDVARALQEHQVGERVAYLIERGGTLVERDVALGPRRLGSGLYFYACFSGFLFFFIGLYVLLRRPDVSQGAPARVFFILCTLFLLFLVCRLRPSSYSWIDTVVLTTGTLSLLALPAAFLHFFLVFPRRLRLTLVPMADSERAAEPGTLRRLENFVNFSPHLFTLLYLLPPLLYGAMLATGAVFEIRMRLVFGAPLANWVLMGDYLVLGLLAILGSLVRAQEGRERRQLATVFAGTVVGVTPFLVLGVALPSIMRNDSFVLLGVVPLTLIPLTFAYAIVRFQFFDIRVMVRRSLLYTVMTVVVSAVYVVGIAASTFLFQGSALGSSPLFPLILALAVVALFDPLRRRLQEPVDRFFFREAYDARRAVEEVSDAVVHEFSLERLDELLTRRLAEVMHLAWAALYRVEGGVLRSATVVPPLPVEIPAHLMVVREVTHQNKPIRPATLEPLKALDPGSRSLLDALTSAGARLLVPLSTRGTLHALLSIGPKLSEEEFGVDDLQLIRTVANQGAVALENARLLHERGHQIELEKELEIARRVQFSLIPKMLAVPRGWQVAARCAPARQVGGDFYDALPSRDNGSVALVVGDVSGKSVAGAMLMVAAREVLHTAAIAGVAPEQLLKTANQRLYNPQPRMFVALAYLLLNEHGGGSYALAGQPTPLVRRSGGAVEELASPDHRLPLGALRDVHWDLMPLQLGDGDLVLMYSDGLSEAQDRHGAYFGEDRIWQVLRDTNGHPETVVSRIMSDLEAFTSGAEPYDDVTMVAVKWVGEK